MESAIVAGMLAAINGAIARDAGVSSCTSTREEDEQDDEGVRRRGRRRNSKRTRVAVRGCSAFFWPVWPKKGVACVPLINKTYIDSTCDVAGT